MGRGTMAKSMKRDALKSSCRSPQCPSQSRFICFEEDIWTEIAKFMDGKCLVKMGLANRWFQRLLAEESVWRFACLRDLSLPSSPHVSFCWRHLYKAAFDGSHSYNFRQTEKHIDWMRIGAFSFESTVALVTENLCVPEIILKKKSIAGNLVQETGACILDNVKPGIWIADLQLVRCPVCNLNSCEGTMQILDVRHLELFLCEGFKNGEWEYQELGSHRIEKNCNGATGGIFDMKRIKSPSTSEITDMKAWMGQANDWQPKARITHHAVAVNTNLQQNEGHKNHVKNALFKDHLVLASYKMRSNLTTTDLNKSPKYEPNAKAPTWVLGIAYSSLFLSKFVDGSFTCKMYL
ncbi:probable F-box protein At3g61730 isoform X1 [Amborella trichopoda]|uniref:probable F-box protein At3g61730 isoform X1 n=1 Tax=Amborella trichopoda TaxID=13333 RepID=UPI0009BD31CE|nr:probable F-box protein At3g61730 isoform X1 [Amborella trichopoda]|eukprot:XP_020527928.1 probable F-box protein At3g61730 isoform X1 [Amborella trichopoda]